MNDRRMRVSGRRQFSEALFATGIPFLAEALLKVMLISWPNYRP